MSEINKLIVQPDSNSATLSKSAKQFNQLMERLHRAEAQLEKTRKTLDNKLNECASELLPIYQQACEVRLELISAILYYMADHNVSNRNAEMLLIYCRSKAERMLMGPSVLSQEKMNELRGLMRDFFGFNFSSSPSQMDNDEEKAQQPYDEQDDEERAIAVDDYLEGIRDHFASLGIELDLDHISAVMTDEEIELELKRIIDATMKELGMEPKKEKKKSKAQLKKEEQKKEFDEMKDKNFAVMYKNLVKLIHPDSEQDEIQKARKTEWMQRLTVAYKSKDVKTLLLIELEWLNTAQDELQRISDEKADYFNAMLKEQITAKEKELSELYFHPRYNVLDFFTQSRFSMTNFNIKRAVKHLQSSMELETSITAEMRKSTSSAKHAIQSLAERFRYELMR